MRIIDNLFICSINKNKELIFNGITGAVDIITPDIAKLLLKYQGQEIEPEFFSKIFTNETYNNLVKRGYITSLSCEQEKAFLLNIINTAKKNRGRSYAGIVTYGCNLRCSYCFERFNNNYPETLLNKKQIDSIFRIIDNDLKQNDLDKKSPEKFKLTMSLYGGEPIQKKTIRSVIHILSKAFERSGHINIITNGVEIAKMIQDYPDFRNLVHNCSVFFQITIDGPKEVHNKRRKGLGIDDSFSCIEEGIDLLLKNNYNTTISIRTNVDKENAPYLFELKQFMENKKWLNKKNVNWHLGVVNPCAVDFNEYLNNYKLVQKYNKEIMNEFAFFPGGHFFKQLFENGKTGQPKAVFCGAGIDLLFDPYWDIYTCWEQVGNKKYAVGTYKDGILQFNKLWEEWEKKDIVEINNPEISKFKLLTGGGCAGLYEQYKGSILSPIPLESEENIKERIKGLWQRIKEK